MLSSIPPQPAPGQRLQHPLLPTTAAPVCRPSCDPRPPLNGVPDRRRRIDPPLASPPSASTPAFSVHTHNSSHDVATTAEPRRRACGAEPADNQDPAEAGAQQGLRRLQAEQAYVPLLIYMPRPSPPPDSCRPQMGVVEPRRLHLHPLLGHPPRYGHAHQPRQVRRP